MEHVEWRESLRGIGISALQPVKGICCVGNCVGWMMDIVVYPNLYIYILTMGVVLNKSSQEPPFRKSFASFRGPIRVACSKFKNSYQESNIWNQTNSNTNYTIHRLLFARMNGSNQNVIVICCFFSLLQLILGRTWLEWIRLSHIFRAPFANLSLEIVKKMSRYYLLSGLSRIFRKPFANVYISRKVPFAQTSQIYACGPRLYKTFHGFLHDSHIYIYRFVRDESTMIRGFCSVFFFIFFQAPSLPVLALPDFLHLEDSIPGVRHPNLQWLLPGSLGLVGSVAYNPPNWQGL